MKLNPQQEKVASHVHGRMLALAGPGSGKTRTLTERTGRLLRRNIAPGSVLCITFTNKARDEMRQRILASCGPNAEKVFISNFHGLCGTILRRMGQPLGYTPGLTICDSEDQEDLILQLGRMRGLELTRPAARTIAYVVNDWRENAGTPAQLDAQDRLSRRELEVGRAYVDLLPRRNQVDFSGLLSETLRLLRNHAEPLKRLRDRFCFIQVDEYQDTNRAQNEIIELLAGPEDNVLAVGDADQSIYEWRGASPDAIPRFIENGQKKTGRCEVVKLGMNYRSTPQIIAVADTLIRHNAARVPIEFRATAKDGEPVKCAMLSDPQKEAEAIASSIHNLVNAGQNASQIAVFYRANDMSRPIEQELSRRRIPYQVVAGGSFYDRLEVKDVLAMLRFVCNPRDGISFARVANKPARGLGDTLIGRIEGHAQQHDLDLLSVLSRAGEVRDEHGKPLAEAAQRACREALAIFRIDTRQSVVQVAQELLTRSRYEQWLKEKYRDREQFEERIRNVRELLNGIADFSRDNPRGDLADYLEGISLYTDKDKERAEESVRLMSLHASKGLEFDVVYIAGLEERVLPHSRALEDRGDRALEEERRLCYVGFTRARRVLRLTYCEKRMDTGSRGAPRYRPSKPSRFLVESGLVAKES